VGSHRQFVQLARRLAKQGYPTLRFDYRGMGDSEGVYRSFENVGPDLQTMSVTYDGKYVLQIFSGFQRLESGVFVFTQDTLEPVGYLPNFGGHHDCVVVPTKTEHLLNSRCTTL